MRSLAKSQKGRSLIKKTLLEHQTYHRYKKYLCTVLLAALISFAPLSPCFAAEAPKLVQKDGRYALMVDGRPYLILGGQIHNSSAWPIELPQVWQSMAVLHANTVETPVYWEQLEAREGHFDFTNVDQIIEGARDRILTVRSGSIRLEHSGRRTVESTCAQLCSDRADEPRDCSTGV